MARDQFIIIVIMMMMIKTPTDVCKIKNTCDLCRLNIMIYTLFILIYVQPNVRFSEFIELAWHSYLPFFFSLDWIQIFVI